eukprot:Seg2091.6 transcript_id=Seg2091.6/GoldUCD/mRNA.D3Y31 product="LanC-like protein 2" protein_id=Seg2091.6/GoldUCD/D3Y31
MSSKRYFENPYPEFDESKDHWQGRKLQDTLCSKLKAWIEEKMQILKQNLSDDRDCSIYTGTTGIALLLMQLSKTVYKDTEKNKVLLDIAEKVCDTGRKTINGKRVTFLCGDAGPLALGAVIAHMKSDSQNFELCINSLTSLIDRCCNDDSLPNEMLYGRSGYLYALLFVQKHCGKECIKNSMLERVCEAILQSGEKLSRTDRADVPLKYTWHGKEYIGAAHGYFGIFYILLQPELITLKVVQEALPVIKECLDKLLLMRFQSGNVPSSVGNDSDRLVQWCHGAPGAVDTLMRAFQVYHDDKYLEAAKACCDVIWKCGLLQKGYGICHGTAGNGYAFLTMYHITKDKRYLYYAMKFGEFCLDYGKHGCRTPDRPLSLFEGLAGTVYFMADLLNPEQASFPAYGL